MFKQVPVYSSLYPTARRAFLHQAIVGTSLVGASSRGRADWKSKVSAVTDSSLILLWQDGGPSPFETFDPKPEAPAEYRGELGAIATKIPGIVFSEQLPLLAAMADKFSVIRSLHQDSSAHVAGTHTFITGHDRTGVVSGPPQYPDLGVIIHRIRYGRKHDLPDYVALGGQYTEGLHRGGSAYLGSAFQPFSIPSDPSIKAFAVPNLDGQLPAASERFANRNQILQKLDRLNHQYDRSGQMGAAVMFRQRAMDLLTTGAATRAFDLNQEKKSIRERYGMHSAGQQALLARRLVEAGVSVVTVRFSPDGRGDDDRNGIGWDDHPVHGNIFRIMRRRGPLFDQSVSALIEDLEQRGLNRKVLVVLAGEFGRTPRVSYHHGTPGRDHWGPAGCALVFGGSMQMGQIIGTTSSRGEYPSQRALRPQDLLATIYRFMGVDIRREFHNFSGRPIPILPFGEPVKELTG